MIKQKSRFLRLFASLVLTLLAPLSQALQSITVKDGGTYQVTISKKEMTRVAMYGKGRIDEYRGVDGMLDVKPDVEAGELYIMPTWKTPEKTSFFVSDDQGNVYTLVARVKDVPSDTVVLKPAHRKIAAVESNSRSNDYVREVKRLMRGMAMGEELPGYEFSETGKLVPLWQEAEIHLRVQYKNNRFVGSVYTLKNISSELMVLEEGEFAQFGEDVRATALEKQELSPGETTRIFVVRGNKNGR